MMNYGRKIECQSTTKTTEPQNKSGGGITQSTIDRIEALENQYKTMIRLLSDKLDASKVTNAATVTEPGWAADARQANPSIEGSLASIVKNIENSLNWKHVTLAKPFPDPGTEIEFEVPELSGSREIVAEIGVGGAPELYRTLFLRNGILSGAYLDRAGVQIATVYVTAFFVNGNVRIGTYKKESLDVRLFSLFFR